MKSDLAAKTCRFFSADSMSIITTLSAFTAVAVAQKVDGAVISAVSALAAIILGAVINYAIALLGVAIDPHQERPIGNTNDA